MSLTVIPRYVHDYASVANPSANTVAVSVTVDNESYLLNQNVKISVTSRQTGALGPDSNLRLRINGTAVLTLFPSAAIGESVYYEAPYYFAWSSPTDYPEVDVEIISAASLTTYKVDLQVSQVPTA